MFNQKLIEKPTSTIRMKIVSEFEDIQHSKIFGSLMDNTEEESSKCEMNNSFDMESFDSDYSNNEENRVKFNLSQLKNMAKYINKTDKCNYFIENNKNRESIIEKKVSNESKNKLTDETVNRITADFIINNLNHDKRIESFHRNGNLIYIYFWNLKESLSFYNQYLKFFEMKFTERWETEYKLSKGNPQSSLSYIPWRESSNNFLQDFKSTNIQMNIVRKELKFGINEENQKVDDSKHATLEERIKYFHKQSKYYTLSEVKKIQQIAESKNFEFILRDVKFLVVGSQTNTFMQEAIKLMTQSELYRIITILQYDIGPISASKYGAYVMQVLIDSITDTKLSDLLILFIKPYATQLIKHPIGNYTMQKIIRLNSEFICNIFIEGFKDIACDSLGIKVLKKCLPEIMQFYESLCKCLVKNSFKFPKECNEIRELIQQNLVSE